MILFPLLNVNENITNTIDNTQHSICRRLSYADGGLLLLSLVSDCKAEKKIRKISK